MSYVDSVLDSKADKIHVVERNSKGLREYKEYQTNYTLYYQDPKGKYRSIFGDPLSKFQTRKKVLYHQMILQLPQHRGWKKCRS